MQGLFALREPEIVLTVFFQEKWFEYLTFNQKFEIIKDCCTLLIITKLIPHININ